MNVRSLTARVPVAVLLLAVAAPLFAADYTATTSGDFNTATNYSPTASLPFTSADHITIAQGVSLTVGSDTDVGSITFASGGGSSIFLNAGVFLNVLGNNINGYGIQFLTPTAGNNLVAVGSGTLYVNEVVSLNGDTSFASGLAATTGGTIDVGGIIANGILSNCKIDLSSGSALFRTDGGIASGITFSRGTSTTEFYGSASPQLVNFSGIYHTVKVTKGTGTFLTFSSILQLDGDLTIDGGVLSDNGLGISSGGTGTTLSIAANAELELGIQTSSTSTGMPSFDTFAFIAGSKVTYGAGAAQTVSSTPVYSNLSIEFLGVPGSHTKTADGDIQIDGDLALLQGGSGTVTFSAGGNIVTVAGAITGNGGMTLLGTGELLLAGDFINTGTFAALGKVTYNGATGQTVKATTYDELAFTGTNTNGLFSGTVTATTLTVDTDSFVTTSGNTLNIGGNATIDGIITGGGTVNFNNSGSFFIDGDGDIFPSVTSNDRTISSGSSLSFGSSFTVTGSILNSGTTTIAVNLNGADALKTWTQDTGSSVVIGGSVSSAMTFDADAVGNTVSYDSGNQTIYATPYYHLIVTSSFPGAKSIPSISVGGNFSIAGQSNATLTGSLTVQGNLDVAATATFDADSFGISIFGDWTNIGTFTPGTGSVGFDGSGTQEVSGGPFYNVSFSDPGQTDLNASMIVQNHFVINATAIVAAQGGGTISVGGNWNNSGTYVQGTTEVLFDGTAQTIGATLAQSFYKLTIDTSSTSVFSGPQFDIDTDLAVDGSLLLGTTYVPIAGNLTIDGTLNMSTGTIELQGDFTHNGTFTSGGSFTFIGTSTQSLSGTAANIEFATVTFDNATGIGLGMDVAVNSGSVNFTDGVVAMATGKMLDMSGGTVTRTNGYLVGAFERSESGAGAIFFPTGSASTGYAPMTFTPTTGGTLKVEVIDAPHPSNTGGDAEILQIYWKIHSSTFTGTADFIFDWQPAAVNGTEANYVVAFHDGSQWSTPGGTVNTNSASINGVSTYVGDWTAADPASVTDLSYFEITANASTTAGTSENITITAKDGSNATLTGYAGDHTLVFSGASNAPDGTVPVVFDKDLNPIDFGNNTVLTFTNGVANTTVNLFAAESITVTATEGTVIGVYGVNVTEAAASELAFSDVNGGNSVYANGTFYVTLDSTDSYGNLSGVSTSTDVLVDTSNCGGCTGTISTATGTFSTGISQIFISGIVYDTDDSNVVLTAQATLGDALTSGDSAPLTFLAQAASIIVTTDADSGAGSLREALELNNAGGCVTPCNITFEILPAGAYTIALTTGGGLPSIVNPIALDATTQDGYSTFPMIGIDGTSVGRAGGFMLESTASGSTIKGLSITNFFKGIAINGDNNVVESCWIGLDVLGVAAGNDFGIDINDGSTNTIGGTLAGAGNVIAANVDGGIQLQGTTTLTTIVGNIIGLDPTGTAAMSNGYGIKLVEGATTNTIGGTSAAERNVISGNASAGIYFEGGGFIGFARTPGTESTSTGRQPTSAGIGPPPNVTANKVYGNYIGTNAAGTSAVGNSYGIQLAANAKTTTIGSTGGPNVISGNVKAIHISDSTAEGNIIHSNYIGVNASLTSIPNTFAGIVVGDGLDNHIGGVNAGEGNIIATNNNQGILVQGGTGTVILGNSIYDNTGQGIDLNGDGPDANDATDADFGANGTQNYPDITSAELAGSDLNLTFSLDSTDPNAQPAAIRVEIFQVDDGTSEEGKTLIGASPCLLGAAFANYTLSFTGTPLTVGDEIVATATSYNDAGCGAHDDGTSEFSPATVVAACTPPAVTITGPAAMCAGTGPVTLDAGTHTSYLWSTAETTQTIVVNPGSTQTYTVTVTDAAGCSNTDSHTVTVNSNPTVAITGAASACDSAVLSVPGGFASYSWSTTETTNSITVTSSGTYSVTVTDANGCTATDSHTITITSSPTVTIAGPATSCGPATLDAGPTFVSYLWSTSETTQTISATTSGTYSVTVTDGNGCTATDTHTITVHTVPTATITGPATSCGPATLDAGGGFVSYLWSTTETTQTISATTSGTYSVTVTDANGCTATDSHTITINPAASVTITGPATSCGPATLDAGGGFVSYLWSTSETSQTISAASSGTYSVTVTDANGCTATDTHTITINPAPTATIIGPATSCGSATLDAGGGFVGYLWSTSETTQTITATTSGTYSVTVTDANGCTATDSHTININPAASATITGPATSCGSATLDAGGGFVSYLWSTSETTQTISASSSGTYSVTVTDANGCTATDTHTITVNPAPTATIIGPATSCGPATLDAGGGFVGYLWSTSETTQTISATTSGTYSVTVTDANGCTATDSHTITINPVATVTITGPATSCGPATLDAGGGFVSYLWSTAETTQTISAASSGTYSVTVTDANGCTATDSHTITINPVATVTITGPATSCGPATLDAGGGFVGYLWSTSETTQTISVSSSGTYSVTVTDANGCTATDSHAITINPAATVTITGPTTSCGPATLDAGGGFVSYLWSTSETTQTISAASSGTYSVTVTDANGCTATDSHTITINLAPTATIIGPATSCGPATLDAGAGFVAYLWSTGETTQTISASSSDTYSVTVTDANSCTASDTHAITINPVPTATITGPATSCGPATLDAGGGFVGYLWSTGETTQTISATTSGTYSVTVTDANGCTASDSHAITINPVPTATITGPATSCGPATLDAGGGFVGYLWSTGETTQTISATTFGTYSVTVTDANGCTATDSHAITINPVPTAAITGPATSCGPATLDAGGGFVGYLWSTGETTQTISATTSGTYSVTVTDANGCTATDTHAITINPVPTAAITGPATSCGPATLDAGAGFAAYLWSTGETTQSISATTSGTYSVTVTDANGCTATDTHAITINPVPTAAITGPANACGSASLDAGPGFISYLWSTAETTQTINVTASGTYSVTVTDANGCTASDSHTIVVAPGTPVTIAGPATACDNAVLDAGSGFVSYLWSTSETTQTINVTVSGTYSVTVTDANGCVATDSHAITINPSPAAVITGPATACGSASLDAGAGYASYLWSTGETTQTINVTTTDTYNVTVTDANGCSATDTHAITISAGTPVTITGPSTACGSAVLDAGSGFASYLWSTGETTQTITVTAGGTYSVTATDANGCSATDSHTITVSPNPGVVIIGPASACDSAVLDAGPGFAGYLWSTGETTQAITVTAGGTYSVTITDANGCTASDTHGITVTPSPVVTITGPTASCATATLDAGAGFASYYWSTGETTQTINVSASGTYSVTVTDGSGCSGSDTHGITINPAGAANITGPASMCPGQSVVLDAGIGFASYLWSTGETTQTITVSPAATQTFSVTVSDGNGCNGSDTHQVTVFPAATATITPGGPTTFCAGGNVTLSANAGASYLWSTGATSQSIVVSTGGTFTVTVTDANGCSATSSPQSVVVEPLPTPIISGPTATCAAAPVTLDAGAGFASYLWSTGATTQTITVSPSVDTTYSVTVTANGCSGNDSHTVTVTTNPVATITAPASLCAGATGTASVAAQGGATYLWTIGNGTINGSAANDTISFTAGATGSVTLGVTVTNGSCTSTGNTSVPIATSPAVNISGPASVCPGATFTLDAGAGFASYLWSTGETTQTILLTQSTATATYSVTVANAAGCSATDTHAVTLKPTPSAAITAPASADPNTAGLTASVAADTNATYTWGISNGTITAGQGSPSITFTSGASGSTKLNVLVVLDGCSAASFREVIINGAPPPDEIADLSITKSAAASVQAGATLVYTINVSNAGPDAATDVAVSDILPSGTTFVSFTGGSFNCAQLPSGFFCSGALAAGDSTTITITVHAPQQSGTITNVATVESTIDPNPNNDSASATTNVIAAPANCATVPPSLLSPADNATVTSPATLSWSAVDGALEYEVWLVSADGTSLAEATSNTSMTKALPSGAYSWFVIARLGTDCESLTSAQQTFTVQQSQNCSTQAPQLTAPTNGTLASPVAFSWMAVPQAIGYRVWIEVDGTAVQDLGTTDGALSLTANVPAGTIVAYVDAIFGGCPETRSAPVTFLVAEPDPCANRTATTLIAPAPNAIVNSSSVDFRWNAVNGADGYRVWSQIDGGTPAVLGITTEETTLRANIGFGTVDWWIETLYDGCASVDSLHSLFTIPRRGECTQSRPDLIAPANNSTVGDAAVTFSWNAVPNAIEYEVWLSVGAGTPTLIGTTNATTLAYDVPPGKLEWFVRAIVDGCPSRDSQTFRFEYETPDACLDAQRAIGTAPLHNARITSPVDFVWTRPAGAVSFDLFVVRGNDDPQFILSTADAHANNVELANSKLRWFVRTHFAGCSPLDSAKEKLEVIDEPAACVPLDIPQITAEGQISSGLPFVIQWDAIPGATSYQLQLASNAAFDGAELITTDDTSHALARTNTGAEPLPLFARVRAIDSRCSPEATVTPYGDRVVILILPASGNEGAAPLDGGIVTFNIPLGSELAGQSFSVTVKESWVTVTPASGIVAPGGTTLVVTANTTGLPLGTSLAAVRITLETPSSGNVRANATSVSLPTISISKVTPVNPTPSSTPPPDALIIPAVAHADGINSKFQSDVRVTNSSAQLLQYQVSFTPSGMGIANSKQTQFSIEPGRTIALDDVLKSWFGTGGASVTGTLQIRPLTQTATSTSSAALSGLPNLVTFAASRTFNVTANGTFGQYIPAIPFANFIGKAAGLAPTVLSLQQIAQSDRYRTNLGIVEASGQPASLLVKVFGDNGTKLTEFPVNLAGGQHMQLNAFLTSNGISSLSDGRVEISVTSNGGKVTAYASVLDNQTNDPLLVSPVTVTDAGASKWVLPGVADINNGTANWQTDMRVFNAGTEAAEATFLFYSQNGGAPKTATISVPPGQVKQFDKTLATLFGVANDGGAVHITTPAASRLVATARTYNQTSGGTYGQFISAVTPGEAAGLGSRPLQILQVEESSRFRSNIGLAEVTGNPVKLELTIVPPDAKFTAVTELTLQANEFRQLNSMLKSAGLSDTFNARVTVRAIEGNGRVTAYASVIDLLTNDPTFVPAQ